jgi:hypothetical protein
MSSQSTEMSPQQQLFATLNHNAVNNIPSSQCTEMSPQQQQLFAQKLDEYTNRIAKMTFKYNVTYNTTTKYIFPMPHFTEKLTELLFIYTLTKNTSKNITLFPMKQILVTDNDDEISAAKSAYWSGKEDALNCLRAVIDDSLLVNFNIYSLTGIITIPINLTELVHARCAYGDKYVMTFIKQHIEKQQFFITSEHNMNAITDDIHIVFTFKYY